MRNRYDIQTDTELAIIWFLLRSIGNREATTSKNMIVKAKPYKYQQQQQQQQQ
jgi:hypothetical protein